MSLDKGYRRVSSRRASVAAEEEKVWMSFYRRAGDPATAAELIRHFEADPEMKHAHPALYLRCKEAVRRDRERQIRAKRIGQFVRMLTGAIVIGPMMVLRRVWRLSGDIAVECLPEAPKEPAARRIRNLATTSRFTEDRNDFATQDNPAAEPPSGTGLKPDKSSSAKTA